MKWFAGINNIDELKKMYHKLSLKFHPDINPSGEKEMKEINVEYEQAFTYILKNSTEEQKSKYNKQGHNIHDGYREIINKIIHIPDIIIEICGSWVWISGNSKPVKDQLKQAGFFWAKKKIQWYWRPEEYKQVFNKKSMTMDYIRDKYGSERVINKPYSQLEESA
jgi:hypothetical protein